MNHHIISSRLRKSPKTVMVGNDRSRALGLNTTDGAHTDRKYWLVREGEMRERERGERERETERERERERKRKARRKEYGKGARKERQRGGRRRMKHERDWREGGSEQESKRLN